MIQFWERSVSWMLTVSQHETCGRGVCPSRPMSPCPCGKCRTRQHRQRSHQSLQTLLKLHWLMNVKLQKQSQSLLPGKLSTKQGGRKGPALLDEAANILIFSVLCDLASKQLSCPQPVAFLHGWPSLGTVRGAHSASSAETTWFNTGLMAGRRNLQCEHWMFIQ